MNILDPSVHILRNKHFPSHGTGLSLDGEYLVTGGNSGFQALNVAVLSGADRIVLIGYDSREPEHGQPSHFFGHHKIREPIHAYELYRKAMKDAAKAIKAAGVRIINCSPDSAINDFEKMELREALQ